MSHTLLTYFVLQNQGCQTGTGLRKMSIVPKATAMIV